jgi:hypothetical protein
VHQAGTPNQLFVLAAHPQIALVVDRSNQVDLRLSPLPIPTTACLCPHSCRQGCAPRRPGRSGSRRRSAWRCCGPRTPRPPAAGTPPRPPCRLQNVTKQAVYCLKVIFGAGSLSALAVILPAADAVGSQHDICRVLLAPAGCEWAPTQGRALQAVTPGQD